MSVRCPSEPAEPSQLTSPGLQPHVCAHCWIDAGGMGIPLVLNSQQTADSGCSDHLSHQPCQGRICPSWVRNSSVSWVLCSQSASNSLVSHAVAPPGGVAAESVESSSANSVRCKFWFMLYYRKGCEMEAGFSFSSDSFHWQGLFSVWVWLNQSLLASLDSFPSLLTKACLTCSRGQSNSGQKFKNKIWEAFQLVLF